MGDEHRDWVWRRSPYTGGGLVVHLALAESANDAGVVQDDAATLSQLTRTTPAHVRRIIGELVDEGLAVILEPAAGRRPAVVGLVCVDAPIGASNGALTNARARQATCSTNPSARQRVDGEQAHLPLGNSIQDQDTSTRRTARRAPRPHEQEARDLVGRVWQRLTPPPAQKFVAVVQIAEKFLALGFDAKSIEDAMVEVPTISTGWVEGKLRRGAPPAAQRGIIIDDRTTPGGRIQL